jgi:hypothetical protein
MAAEPLEDCLRQLFLAGNELPVNFGHDLGQILGILLKSGSYAELSPTCHPMLGYHVTFDDRQPRGLASEHGIRALGRATPRKPAKQTTYLDASLRGCQLGQKLRAARKGIITTASRSTGVPFLVAGRKCQPVSAVRA